MFLWQSGDQASTVDGVVRSLWDLLSNGVQDRGLKSPQTNSVAGSIPATSHSGPAGSRHGPWKSSVESAFEPGHRLGKVRLNTTMDTSKAATVLKSCYNRVTLAIERSASESSRYWLRQTGSSA